MESNRNEALRRGLRVAAQVAAVGGLIAASAGMVRAEQARAGGSEAASSPSGDGDEALRISEVLRVRQTKNCGCTACWGPPAPPAMPARLLARLEAVAA